MRSWIAIVVMMAGIVAPTCRAQTDAEALPKTLVEAWKKQGHDFTWIGIRHSDGAIGHQYTKDGLMPNSALPSFSLSRKSKPELLAKLPQPTVPFGIEIYLARSDGDLLPPLKEFKNLTRLYIGSSPLDEKELLAVAEITQLEELQFYECKISDDGLKELTKLKNLRKLGLRGSKITNAGLKHLKAFDKLEHLELGSNLGITDEGAPAIAELKTLKYLDIYLTWVKDEGMNSIAKMSHLRGLYVMNTKSTAKGLKALGALKDLERFQIDGHGVNTDTISAVLGMKKLKYLTLNIAHADKTAAGDAEFKQLAALKDIEELAVFGWQITDASLPVIRSFEKLRHIDLGYTSVKKESAKQLQKDLPKCNVFLP
jgi:Leucine-rich repeat (LRR) protein